MATASWKDNPKADVATGKEQTEAARVASECVNEVKVATSCRL